MLFGKYKVLGVIGEGGTGSVWLAEHISLGVRRAIKSIIKNRTSSECFFFEANILKNLRHPGIPIIYDIEEDDDCYYVIEEYIEGVSLEQYFQEYPNLSNHRRIDIIRQLCDVIEYLHDYKPYPIIHLDIKPQNIVVSEERIYLIDFGNGYMMHSGYTRHYYYGTSGYASPEQYAGDELNTMSDMYALAKTVIYILGSIIDNELSAMLDECINRTEGRFITAKDIRDYLICTYYTQVSRTIFIYGTHSGIGTTHLALALVNCMNAAGSRTVYACEQQKCVQDILQESDFELDNEGIAHIRNSYCRIMTSYGLAKPYEDIGNVWKIVDAGVIRPECIKANMNIILICGGREWEKDSTFNVMMELGNNENVNILKLFNYKGDMEIPYIRNPFKMSVINRLQLRKILSVIKKWK